MSGILVGESAKDNTWWNSKRRVSEGQHLVEGEAVLLMASLFEGEAALLMASLFLFLILFSLWETTTHHFGRDTTTDCDPG